MVREELTLERVADQVDFPILSVCSADDETMPTTESAQLRRRVKGPVEVVTFPGKGHGGPSRLSLPLEADWLRDKLCACVQGRISRRPNPPLPRNATRLRAPRRPPGKAGQAACGSVAWRSVACRR